MATTEQDTGALERLTAWLDAAGIGSGAVALARVGDGHSNLTYVLRRDEGTWILRRPPEGPLPPSAHDVLREARWMQALGPLGVRVPRVLGSCEDAEVIGAPFIVMEHLQGHVPTDSLPAAIDDPEGRGQLAREMIQALVELHAVDPGEPALAEFVRPGDYVERQLRRFSQLWEKIRTREMPPVDRVGEWLAANRPAGLEPAPVHGDARPGNAVFTAAKPVRLVGLLDWELAAIGDPLADLGYLLAIWPERDDPDDPLFDVGKLSRLPGFPSRAEMIEEYGARSGRPVADIRFYEVLALWKAVILMEANYSRFRQGTADNEFIATFEEGLPLVADRAAAAAGLGAPK